MLAEQKRWRSIVAVTSTYHLRRARQALNRCYGGVVATAAVPVDHLWDLPRQVAREWAGLVVTATCSGTAEAGQVPASWATIGATASTSPPRLT